MAQQKKGQQQKKKGCSVQGRGVGGYSRWAYNDQGGGPMARKLRRIIQSNGYKAAADWAEKNGAMSLLGALAPGVVCLPDELVLGRPTHLRVGRALRRHMARLGKKGRQKQEEMKKAQVQQSVTPPVQPQQPPAAQ